MAGKYDIIRDTEADNSWQALFREDTEIKWVHVEYTSSATAGNREVALEVLDESDNVVLSCNSAATQAASLVNHHEFFPGTYREPAFALNAIQTPIPKDLVIPANHKLRVRDTAGIHVGDSIVVSYQRSHANQ